MQYVVENALQQNNSDVMIPSVSSVYSMITADRMAESIWNIIKLENPVLTSPDSDSLDSKLDNRKEIFISGYTNTLLDYTSGISSILKGFNYKVSNELNSKFTTQWFNNMKAWPEVFHDIDSDKLLGYEVVELSNSVKYKTQFKEMLVNNIINSKTINSSNENENTQS